MAFASVYPEYAHDVGSHRFYSFPDVSRLNKSGVVLLVYRLFRILLKERPDVVVTTGSFPVLVAIALARIFFGAKTIWIDSIANCERLSTSGAKARYFADVYLTQWPNLAAADGPQYWGAVS